MEELAVRNLWRRAVTFPHGRASSEKLVKGERPHFPLQELAVRNF